LIDVKDAGHRPVILMCLYPMRWGAHIFMITVKTGGGVRSVAISCPVAALGYLIEFRSMFRSEPTVVHRGKLCAEVDLKKLMAR
jgi:hypothetical protein